MENLANIIIESLVIYFFFFLYSYKWGLVNKWFIKDTFIFRLISCVFCVSFWLALGGWYFSLIDNWYEAFPIAIICLFTDIIFRKIG